MKNEFKKTDIVTAIEEAGSRGVNRVEARFASASFHQVVDIFPAFHVRFALQI